MSDRSFVRFGGLAGILLAVTSWVAVVEYYALVPAAQRAPIADREAFARSLGADPTGLVLFNGLLALTALWALFGTVATYHRVRRAGQAWAAFATLVGAIAAAGWFVAGIYDLANAKLVSTYAAASSPGLDQALRDLADGPSPVNPLGATTFALTAVWFLIVALLMPRAGLPRPLALLGFVAAGDLAAGFIASLAGADQLAILARIVAGAVGGPLFWLWLGILLWRDPRAEPSAG